MAEAAHLLHLLLFFFLINHAFSDDVKCLQGIKQSLNDPQKHLSSWDFSNTTAGAICTFNGITCWNDHENRVLSIRLSGFQLSGNIPDSIRFCTTNLQHLDLSGNSLSGSIPPICQWLTYLVSVNFAGNQLSGEIPASFGDCVYLNSLNLSNNHLSGYIPFELGNLERLSYLSVANNNLKGKIPIGLAHFDASSFDGNNLKLGSRSKRDVAIIIAAGVCGAAFSLLLTLMIKFKQTKST